jgi:hypothetical protein
MAEKKTRLARVVVLCLAALLLIAFGPASATAYDKKKCNKAVEKIKKHLKSHRGLKLKTLYKKIDKVDEKEGGWDAKELEAAVDPPFEDLSWTKKFVKYLNKVEQECSK